MTKIGKWKCDICGEIYDSKDRKDNTGFTITIPSGSMYETETDFSFDDTCTQCRNRLRETISILINE